MIKNKLSKIAFLILLSSLVPENWAQNLNPFEKNRFAKKFQSETDPFENVQSISLETLEALLKSRLDEEVSGPYKFELGRHPFPVDIIADEPVALEVLDLTVNPEKTRFTVKISFKGFDTTPFNLSGNIIALSQVPALNRSISPQEVIQAEDIVWIDVPTRLINRSTVTQLEQLIGAQPRHTALKTESVLKLNDIQRTKSVKRGSLVKLVLDIDTLHIEMQAKALEDGEIGSIIKFTNLSSQQTIQGKVTGVNSAEVTSTSFQNKTPSSPFNKTGDIS